MLPNLGCHAAVLDTPAAQLSYLRAHTRPYWTPAEAGGVYLLGSLDEKENNHIFEPVLGPMEGESDKVQRDKVNKLADAIGHFFETAQLKPGSYELDNYHLDYATRGKLAFDADGHPATVLATGKRFRFTVTDTHLKLIRHLNTRSWHGIVELMDPKRPYGDFTYYYADMADALGEPVGHNAAGEVNLPPAAVERYIRLHRDMLFAIQAFWTYAK
jgi:hypothetical protein